MDVLHFLGRVLFGALFVTSALGHLTQTQTMAGYAASRGVPMATPMTLLTGVRILLGFALTVAQENPSLPRWVPRGPNGSGGDLAEPTGREAVEHVMAGFSGLAVHPDVPGGVLPATAATGALARSGPR